MSRASLLRICGFVVVLVLVPGCHTGARSIARPGHSFAASVEAPPQSASDVLGFAEIDSARIRVDNAYDAVRRFRPHFLQSRPIANSTRPVPAVFIDGARQDDPEALRSIPVNAILEIRHYSATAAAQRFGPGYPGGIIVVRRRH